MRPTRRQFLIAGTTAALSGVGLAAQSSSEGSSLSNLVMHPYGSTEYSSILAENYPQLRTDRSFAAIAPLSAIFGLTGNESILALAVNWSFSTASGGYVHPLELESPAGQHSTYAGQRTLIGPGTFLLVTPFFGWNPRTVPAAPINWASVTAKTGSRRFVSTEAILSQSAQPVVRGVVFANGTVAGDATKHLIMRALNTQAGARDASLSIHKMLRAKATSDEVTARLEAFIARPPNKTTALRSNAKRIYEEAWRTQSKFLLEIQYSSPNQFPGIVKRIARQNRLKITSAA